MKCFDAQIVSSRALKIRLLSASQGYNVFQEAISLVDVIVVSLDMMCAQGGARCTAISLAKKKSHRHGFAREPLCDCRRDRALNMNSLYINGAYVI
jgi:hypothetical protein